MSEKTDLPNVLCVGRLYCDLIFTGLPRMPTTGSEVYSDGVGLHAGGGAAVTAGHLAALGHETALAAHLPAAALGDVVVRELDGVGVDLRFCHALDEKRDPQITVALVYNGERAFVTHRAGRAFPKLGVEDVARMGIDHIHVGEATTLIDNPELVGFASDVGATLSLDCSWDENINGAKISRLLPEVDVFLPNEAEVELLRELGVPELLSKLTVIKQGPKGATAISNGTEVHSPAVSAVVVDTTGAGDAFNAGFLSAWLKNETINDCLKFGNARGAEKVAHRGGLGGVPAKRAG